jgi:perosamine synthetase
MFKEILNLIRQLHPDQKSIPLHKPYFDDEDKLFLNKCIDTSFVSTAGQFTTDFEQILKEYSKSKYVLTTINGTSALQLALKVVGVESGDEVLTQKISFVATANAIVYNQAEPIFIDSQKNNMGMDPELLEEFLTKNTKFDDFGKCINLLTNKIIKACVPVHVLGQTADIIKIVSICDKFNIPVIEDAAEALGSTYNNKHLGTFGALGILSFNGNKIITTGGGGAILINQEKYYHHLKHLITLAKIDHPWEISHDEVGFNFRMPSLNAALGLSQIKKIDRILKQKKKITQTYNECLVSLDKKIYSVDIVGQHNNWINAVIFSEQNSRDEFLKISNIENIFTKPIWMPLNNLKMYQKCLSINNGNAEKFYEKIVLLPSSVCSLENY